MIPWPIELLICAMGIMFIVALCTTRTRGGDDD